MAHNFGTPRLISVKYIIAKLEWILERGLKFWRSVRPFLKSVQLFFDRKKCVSFPYQCNAINFAPMILFRTSVALTKALQYVWH
jgi:hypothetical protein